jgi:hypothetical protein
MEDLGVAKFIIRLELERHISGDYTLHQQGMIQNVIDKFNMANCKPPCTPFGYNLELVKSTDQEHNDFVKINNRYRSAVGSLMYIAVCTHPDISFAVGVLS